MELKQKLNNYLTSKTVVEKIILINIIIYLCPFLFKTILFLFQINDFSIINWFTIDANLNEFILKPWSLLTYGFLHGSFSHIFWNMVIFYYFGNIVQDIFGEKFLVNLFISGIIVGGLTYFVSYNLFPAFKGINSVMIGASAGVMSVLFFLTAYNPKYPIRIIFFDVKILYIAIFLIFYDITQIPLNNSGGHIAHIGGAAWGYYSFLNYNKENNIIKSFLSFFNFKKNNKFSFDKESNNFNQKKIDEILDKISSSGYDSLSNSEKDYLFKAGKNNKK
tara:strand:- start:774 stop:1604 length:831 start_codon:yes stop_codon:yes gene_type:complete